MTKSTFLFRILVLGLLTVSLGETPIFGQPAVRKPVLEIGDFSPASPAGWTHLEDSKEGTDVVFYYKILGTNQITLTFSWIKDIDDGARRISRDRSLLKAGKSMFTPSTRPNTRYKVVAEQLFTLNGVPAVMHKTVTKGSGRTEIGETIQFAYNKKFYVLTRGLAFPSPKADPKAEAELKQGWSTLSKTIRAQSF